MKSGEEIVAFIDQYMEWAMERPEMYAEDPAALESIFFVLEQVRQFAVVDSENPRETASRYGFYLGEQGFGAMCFTTDASTLPHFITDEMKQSFRPFIEFWKGYLAWRDRT
jgi:hypothetical protein